jgi:DNA polymerase-1
MIFAFDLETFLIQPGLPAPRLVCGSWANPDEEWIGNPEETKRFFVSALERGDHLVGVNLAYDIVVMAAAYPELIPLIFKAGDAGQFHDCAVREALHDIALDLLFVDYRTGKSFSKEDLGGRYSMAVLMGRHFNKDISEEKQGDVWRYKYASLHGKPINSWPQAAIDYPKQDARRTWDIWHKQETHKNLHDEAAQVRATIAIQFMCTWGFRTDGAYIDHLEVAVDQAWNSARAEFGALGIYKPDGVKDTELVRNMVNEAYKGQPPRTPKGLPSMDRDTLIESGNPILEKLGTLGKNDKRKTVYLPAVRKGVHVPVTPSFNVLVDTGRLSSDWQQMPQKGGIREAVIARPGTVIGSLDYGGLELRTMSQRAINVVGYSKMAEYLNTGKDAHSYVGGFFLGLTYEEFLARKVELKAYRDVAKMFNFGAGGGAGAAAIAYNAKVKDNIRLCLSLNRAKVCGVRKDVAFVGGKEKRICSVCVQVAGELKRKWLLAWPEQDELFKMASQLTRNKKKVDSITFGSNRVRGKCGYTQWLNNPFQGAGGDGCKAAMWNIDRECYTDPKSPLWGSRIFLNVHDELLIEFPYERRHEAAFRAAKIMVDTMDRVTPDVKNEVVPAIMRRLFKSAVDVYDKQGILKPYWPSTWDWPPDQTQMQLDKAA